MDEVRIDIDAPAELVYDLVANLTDMGRWSPETHRVAWLDGATEAVPGARFKGWNKAKVRGVPAAWWTTSVVRQTRRGEVLSWDTPFSGARWTYRFTPTSDATACEVVETREEISHPPLVKVLYGLVGATRRSQLRAGMAATLERIKAAAEEANGR